MQPNEPAAPKDLMAALKESLDLPAAPAPDPVEAVREALTSLDGVFCHDVEDDARALSSLLLHAPAVLARLEAAERDAEHFKGEWGKQLQCDAEIIQRISEKHEESIASLRSRLSAAEARADAAERERDGARESLGSLCANVGVAPDDAWKRAAHYWHEAYCHSSAFMIESEKDRLALKARADAAWPEAVEAAASECERLHAASPSYGLCYAAERIRALPAPSEGEAKR